MTEFTARQVALEQSMADLGSQRYWSNIEKARKKERESATPAGRRLLREAVGALADAFKTWLVDAAERPGPKHAATRYLSLLEPDVSALITAKFCLDAISHQRGLTSSAIQLASLLEDEVRFRYLRDKSRPLWENMMSSLKRAGYSHKRKVIVALMNRLESGFDSWGKREKLRLGIVCLELMQQATGLLLIEHRPDESSKGKRRRTLSTLRATPECLEWITKANEEHEALFPFYLPSLVEPAEWDGPTGGGYHTNLILRRALIKTHDKAHRRDIADAEMPEVYDCVNTLQRTAWEINPDVYEVLAHFWETGTDIADLPSRDDEPLPSKPTNIKDDLDARRAWRKLAHGVHSRNVAVRSRRIQTAKTLFMARQYLEDPFFFPYQADFRGRLYPVPYFLQPQGPSQSRGLLRFHKGVSLDERGAWWLAIHGANCFGYDKVTLEERRRWVSTHTSEIWQVYKDPIECRWWAEADKPWEFLAFCLEWGAYHEQGAGFVSKIPVAMDGSNNGLQLFSLLLRDPVGARATNCDASDKPQDIYQEVADEVTERLKWHYNTDSNELEEFTMARRWLQFTEGRIPRACAKRPVMTLPYGSTLFSCQKYVTEWYEDAARGKDTPFVDDHYKPCRFLAGILWDSIRQVVKAAVDCMDWLQEIAKLCCEDGVPIRWTSPSGFPVRQSYTHYDTHEIRTTIGDAVRWSNVREYSDQLDKRRQVNGISPNFVHSLDAAALVQTVNLAAERGIESFCMIHDSYGVPAAHADRMARALREVYAGMFKVDQLELFASEIRLQLKARDSFPVVPARGEFDVSNVLESEYFFA